MGMKLSASTPGILKPQFNAWFRKGRCVLSSRRDVRWQGRLTTSANEMVAAVHERMPVIVSQKHYFWWIDDRRDGEAVKFMLRPYPAEPSPFRRQSPVAAGHECFSRRQR